MYGSDSETKAITLTSALLSAVKLKESAATASALENLHNKPLLSGLGAGRGGEWMCFKPRAVLLHLQMERSIQGFLLHCQPGDTPREEIWGMSSQHFSIILRTLSLQHFAVSHIPTVAERPLCFQNWEKFKLSLFLPSTSNP